MNGTAECPVITVDETASLRLSFYFRNCVEFSYNWSFTPTKCVFPFESDVGRPVAARSYWAAAEILQVTVWGIWPQPLQAFANIYQIFDTRHSKGRHSKGNENLFSASCTIFISTLSRNSSWKCFQQCVLNLFYKAEQLIMASFSKKFGVWHKEPRGSVEQSTSMGHQVWLILIIFI